VTHALLARNLHHHARLLLSLIIGLVLFELLIIWFGAEIEAGPGMANLMEEFLPPSFQQIVASQIGRISFPGIVAFGFQHPALLAAAFAFVIAVGTLPAGERESGLLDLLLARPVPRARYLTAVVMTMVVGAILLPAALLAGVALALQLIDVEGSLPWYRYLAPAAGLMTLLLAIGGYTLAIASVSRRRGTAVARAVGLTVAFYLLDFLANLWDPIGWLKWLTPFHYYKPIQAAVFQQTPAENPIVLLALFTATTAIAFQAFHRQDL
jgi:ABC-2 type transport system permease protein